MKGDRHIKVLWIGDQDLPECHKVGEALRQDGLDLEVHTAGEDLQSALTDVSRLVVVFCGNPAEAEQLFDTLRSQYRPIPIVVLSSTPTCGDYYRLAWAGPTYFCTQVDESEPIRRVIQRAVVNAA